MQSIRRFLFLLLASSVLFLGLSCVTPPESAPDYVQDIYLEPLEGMDSYASMKKIAQDYFHGQGRSLDYCNDKTQRLGGTLVFNGVPFDGGYGDGILTVNVDLRSEGKHCTLSVYITEANIYRNGQPAAVPRSALPNRILTILLAPLTEAFGKTTEDVQVPLNAAGVNITTVQ